MHLQRQQPPFLSHMPLFSAALYTHNSMSKSTKVTTRPSMRYAPHIHIYMHVAQVGQCTLQFRVRLHYVYARWPAVNLNASQKKKHSTAPPFSWLQLIVELKTAQLCISVHIFSLSHSERVLLAKKGAVVRCAYLVLIPRVFVTCCPRSFTFCCSCCYSCLLWVTYYH